LSANQFPGPHETPSSISLIHFLVLAVCCHILVEPDDRYLCIVPASSARAKRVLPPFEGDGLLSLILSKALLLAADDKITDPTILHQLERRA
jgi:hypothetical protein